MGVYEESPLLDKPQIVQTKAQLAAIIRFTIPRAEIRNVMGPGIGELLAAVAAQGMAPAGPVFSHHLRMDPDAFDFEIGVPVKAPLSAAGRVKPGQLPAATVTRTVHHGPCEGLGPAWAEFGAWIAAEGHIQAPDLWECCVAGPESSPDPAHWRTELNRPLNSPAPGTRAWRSPERIGVLLAALGVQTRLTLYAAAVKEAEGPEMLLSIGRVFARLCGGGEDAALEDLAAINFSAAHISALPLFKSAIAE